MMLADAVPRPGISRRAQRKRSLHAMVQQTPAAQQAPPKRMKTTALRRARTAPSAPADSGRSDASSNTTHGDHTLNKALSCPLLAEGCANLQDAPGTPRIVSLPPAAAAAAASKSPPPEQRQARSVSPPHDAASETAPTCPGSHAAATADTAATRNRAARVATSPSPEATLAPVSAPPATLSLRPGASPPATPTVVTPPPETPRMGRGRGRGRGRAQSAEPRTGGYQGRFCGRLFLKEDEAKLATECQLLGPLLGCSGAAEGGPEHDAGRHTLAKIVRAMASGAVRAHCLQREAAVQELEARLAAQQAAVRQSASRLAVENQAMRAQLGLLDKSVGALAAAQALVSLPPPAAASSAAPPVFRMPAPRAPPAVSAITAAAAPLIAGFPQFAGPPLPQLRAPALLPTAPAASSAGAAVATPVASFPMAAAFAASRRSAFAPVPRSPPGSVMRPTPHVGVPPLALRSVATA